MFFPNSSSATRRHTALAAAFLLVLASNVFAETPNAPNVSNLTNTGQDCEALRSTIEAKIAAAGVRSFTVSVVDAQEATSGRVVGSCGLGSKKIVYAQQQGGPAVGMTPAGAQQPRPAMAPANSTGILTECRDGTVSMGGSCKP